MCHHTPDKDRLPVVPDLGDQPVPVAGNVERGAVQNRIGLRKVAPDPIETLPSGPFGYPIPSVERFGGIRVLAAVPQQGLPTYYVHFAMFA
jgi:hypothetical protein